MNQDDTHRRVLEMWEESERKLSDLETRSQTDPENEHMWLDLILEGTRNQTLRTILGRDPRPAGQVEGGEGDAGAVPGLG